MAIPIQSCTLGQFLELPEEKPALEFTHGKVTQKVSPRARHSGLQFEFAARVNRRYRPARVAYAFPELRTAFSGASFVPDISVLTWDRIQRDPQGEPVDDIYIPPDIAVEILTPGQRVGTVRDRCRWYVENGVRSAVLVNPHDRSVSPFRRGGGAVVLRGSDAIDLADVLPGFSPTVADLFALLSCA